MTVSDTAPEIQRMMIEAGRAMTVAERAERTLELCELTNEFFLAGIRQRHPDYDERETWLAGVRLRIGDALFEAAYPDEPLLDA
jgi:hypothetical protein